MIGLTVYGKTYDPLTFEVSLNPILAKVIDYGMATVRIWPNNSQDSFAVPVDVLFCSPWNGVSFSTTTTVRIPFYLLSRIQGATVNTSIAAGVRGHNTFFSSPNILDFSENLQTLSGGIIKKAKCPKIIWANSTNYGSNSSTSSYIGFSDFYVCYPIVAPLVYDLNNIIFFEGITSEFISPTYIEPPCCPATGASGGTGGGGNDVLVGEGDVLVGEGDVLVGGGDVLVGGGDVLFGEDQILGGGGMVPIEPGEPGN